MNLARLGAALFALPALASSATLHSASQPLPIAQVINLSKSRTSPEQVIQRIKTSRTTFALRGSDFAKLKAAGVPDPVLDYLQQSFVDDLDMLTRYWMLGDNLGGCSFCYPQPVDLSTMQSGYAHVKATPPGRYAAGKPPGTPDWVPYPPSGSTGARLSVSQIVDTARRGMSEAKLVQRIRTAQLTDVIGGGGPTAIRSHPAAGLGGAELARLKEQGVPNRALDALQGRFLAAFIEAERLRYQNLGKGPMR
jgi:hypothetical protein